MNVVILAAGYATRLYPLTKNFPKPLLDVGGQSILDRLMHKLSVLDIDQVCVVTNDKYADHFMQWQPDNVKLVNNGTSSVESRLGAAADLQLGLDALESSEACIVSAADNLFPFELHGLQSDYQGRTLITVWQNPDPADQTRRGNVVLQDKRVVQFVEKPAAALTSWAAAPLYLLSPDDQRTLPQYLARTAHLPIEQRDAPGHFFSWLIDQSHVQAHHLSAKPVDIGTPEALAAARRLFD